VIVICRVTDHDDDDDDDDDDEEEEEDHGTERREGRMEKSKAID